MKSMTSLAKFGFWDSLQTGEPWVPYAMQEYLVKHVNRNMTVFEYGSGGSTIFFSRTAGSVTSVEHDRDWHQRVVNKLGLEEAKNCTCYLIEPESGNSEIGAISLKPQYAGSNFNDYVAVIDQFPDESFDVVFVDGRARSACVRRAIRKVKKQGKIMLDNGKRAEYSDVVELMNRSGWTEEARTGLTPGELAWSTTLIFSRPK